MTEQDNEEDMLAELRLLSLAQYFLESFQKRAAHYEVNIPSQYCAL
jgi:hypothetical protein